MKKGAGEAPSAEPRRFLPERRWLGERPGYVFKTGAEGLGYYRDASTTLPADAWRETFASLQREEASARERKREEARRGRQDRVDRSGIDPHDYRRGRDDRKRDRSRSRDDARDRERAEDADARAATSTARDAKPPPARGWRRKPPRWRASPRDARRQRAVTAREGPSAIAGEGVGAGTGEETRGEETAAAAAEAIASDASDGEDPKNALVALRLLDSAPTLRFFSHPYPAI